MKYLFCLLLFTACRLEVKEYIPGQDYSLNAPDKVFVMPAQLNEISGISIANANELYCVEDEHGRIYIYNQSVHKVTRVNRFAPGGDYEDIALHHDTAYVLRTDGTIFKVTGPVVQEYKTGLDASYDPEGLYADTSNNRLLIASKSKSAVYAFDLQTLQLSPPVWKIDHKNFSPAALSIHPATGDVYIISSVGNTLLVLSQQGKIKQSLRLPQKHFKQPEGIAFAQNGDLYISNEGRGGNANILLFRYHSD